MDTPTSDSDFAEARLVSHCLEVEPMRSDGAAVHGLTLLVPSLILPQFSFPGKSGIPYFWLRKLDEARVENTDSMQDPETISNLTLACPFEKFSSKSGNISPPYRSAVSTALA